MQIRRVSHHETVASQRLAVTEQQYWEYQPGSRVMTVDGPGRVEAVHSGPFAGAEDYQIALEGGLGGGTYSVGQITALLSSQAAGEHTAAEDYPELGTLLHDRPDPAALTYTASQTVAMPSRTKPVPEGFRAEITPLGRNKRLLIGLMNGVEAGYLQHHAYHHDDTPLEEDEPGENAAHVGVRMIEVPGESHQRQGVASAMMDHLYDAYPNATIDHGDRTAQGRSWWDSYENPDPSRTAAAYRSDVPGANGSQGPFASEYALPHVYARDIHSGAGNCVCGSGLYAKLHTEAAPGVDFMRSTASTLPDDHHRHLFIPGAEPHRLARDPEDEDYEPPIMTKHADLMGQGDPGGSMTPEATSDDHTMDRSGTWPPEYNHALYHREDVPATNRVAHYRQMDPIDPDDPESMRDHLVHAHGLPGHIMDEYEPQDYADEHEEQHRSDLDDMNTWHPHDHSPKPITYEPVEQDALPAPWYAGTGGRTEDSRHDVLYHNKPFRLGPGEERGIFNPWHLSSKDASLEVLGWELAEDQGLDMEPESGISMPIHNTASSLPSVEAHLIMGPMPEGHRPLLDHLVTQHGYTNDQLAGLRDPGQNDALQAEHELEHDASTYDEGVGGGEFGGGETGEGTEHSHDDGKASDRWPTDTSLFPVAAPNGIVSLNQLIVTAAVDPEFRFHVQASWSDVRAKAKRIRSGGGVSITHADDLTVIGMVQGDHEVYETGLQRVPGRRQSVASYSCGCKWGAYHWGAPDDLSRFAGRMCSHALALQYEAASRGMFGRDVEVDRSPAQWVPSKVVVKYDINDGENIYAHASTQPVPEQSPWIVALASLDAEGLRQVTAATNELFGGGLVEAPATNQTILGPTVPRNPEENPASAGFLSNPDPKNWGSITTNMLNRYSSLAQEGEEGTEATLHDEPEGALPETDGHVATKQGEEPPAWIHEMKQQIHDVATNKGHTMQWQYQGEPKWKSSGGYVAGYRGICTNPGCEPPKSVRDHPHASNAVEATIREDKPGDISAMAPAYLRRACKGGQSTASLGDVEQTEHSPDPDDLEPESASIMTQGGMSDVNLMPGSGIGGIEGTDMEDLGTDDSLADAVTRTSSLSTEEIVAQFQASTAAKSLMGSGRPSGRSGGEYDYVQAAQEHLAKTAAQFSAGERTALIEESPGTQASNTDRLDIAGTHYAEIEASLEDSDDEGWLA